MPEGVLFGIVALQLLLAGALIFFLVKIRQLFKAQGLSGNPIKAYKQIQERKKLGPQ